MAKQALPTYTESDRVSYLTHLFALQLAAGEYETAEATIASLRSLLATRKVAHANVRYAEYEMDSTAVSFITAPFEKPVTVSGSFSGRIEATINKRDMDFGITLYEVMPGARLFELSYFLGRASYARDMSVRRLLTPG